MQKKKYDGADVRKILKSMIMDKSVCVQITEKWNHEGLFDSKWANLVGRWCVDYLKKHGDSPKRQIVDIFERWAGNGAADEHTIESIEKFITAVGDEEDILAPSFVLELAQSYFTRVQIEKEVETAKSDLARGYVEDAANRLQKLQPIELGDESFITISDNYEIWDSAFSVEKRKPIVYYPEDLGNFIGSALQKGEFYSFMGPDKTGKTTNLIDFAYRATRQRNKVAFFDAGDGNEEEFLLLMSIRASGLPEIEGDYDMPIEWDDKDELIFSTVSLESVTAAKGFRSFRRICKNPETFRLSVHSNSTLSVRKLDSILERWDRAGWKPDVVVIDYADILAPPPGVNDPLEQIDETWKQLRRLSQDRNCLVMTATQSNAAAYGNDKGLLSRRHFSGRKTKLAHVNGIIGINVSEDERRQGCARWNWVVRRKARSDRTARYRKNYVEVAGCYPIGNPVVISRW